MRGFSLVELSIVLVILGLLTGGILSGQSLIRAAELRSVTSDLQRYESAVYSFRDKYLALPGDMRNAVRFWGAQAGGMADGVDSTCIALTTAATSTATCNGNGDGMIENSAAGNTSERHRFWQHLANAGLIEGTYTGVRGPAATGDVVIGTNAPAAKINSAGFGVLYRSTMSGESRWFDGNYQTNVLSFGADISSDPWEPMQAALKPEELWNIDSKIDDQKPASGRIISTKGGSPFTPNCTLGTTSDATYNLSHSSTACMFYYMLERHMRPTN